ncbi:SigE family RNA polymerase sigma factor [Kribbella pittospori]|uniref:SigE family RNA polymerase sigma factor n=1 Tax=Kribbella pittospori TaxID=722689 RepID=A0A4R0KT70_9ACTN|nr:SigE family RNA polymerase sigma factor [Kribbella pittospori]TCC63217.1 SigE family RNA polymerase sigma factor [Kribbella pittospori]
MTFEEWARQGVPDLLRFATVLCGSGHLAEDLVQDTVIKAHRHWGRIQRAERPDAYLRRMVVNEYLSWRRKWSRFVPRPEIWAEADHQQPDHAVRLADQDEMVAELAKLPRRQRTVLALRYYGGLTDSEIAETIGCSPNTVRSYASRALAALRIELGPSSPATTAPHGVINAH